MSFAVTFNKPVVVAAEQLAAFLAMAGEVEAQVAVYTNGHAVEIAAMEPAAQVETPATPAAEGKRRGRPAKAKEETPPAAAEPQASQPAASSAPEELQKRFTDLVSKDYDKALEVLGNFGVSRFTELKPEQHSAIADVLTHFGV